ncbi:MAG: hypothetical protein ACI4TD_10065, partial [Phocaeicola sp.]
HERGIIIDNHDSGFAPIQKYHIHVIAITKLMIYICVNQDTQNIMLMKTAHFFSIVAGFICLASCSNINRVDVKNPINISSPSPAEQLTKVSLNDRICRSWEQDVFQISQRNL